MDKYLNIKPNMATAGVTLVDEIFNMIDIVQAGENANDTELIIEQILGRLGAYYHLDIIVIKESFKENDSIKCAYEWSIDGRKLLVGTEMRYMSSIWPTWKKRYRDDTAGDGVYIYYNSEGECPIKLMRRGEVETLVQIPMYKGDDFLGCAEFIDSHNRREWSNEELTGLKIICKALAMFLFSLRTFNEMKLEIRRMVAYDSVTKLPKYDKFYELVQSSIETNDGMGLAIVCSDIMNFKFINEKYGYSTGDMLLRMFAEKCYSNLNRVVSCCREYSDNFIMAFKINDEDSDESIKFKVDRLNNRFTKEAHERIFDSNLSVNAGIFLVRDGVIDIDIAVSNANLARKFAKEMKSVTGSRSVMFKTSMTDELKRRLELVTQMDQAIEDGEFKVFLQPKVLCDTMEIVGAEALIRWQKPDGHFIFPDEFIPAFEQDGCIIRMDYFVYRTVFSYIRKRLDEGFRVVPISMNVSRVHLFNTSFVKYIESLFDTYQIPPEYVEFELTENIYIEDLPMVLYTLEKLRKREARISIDDFGSGYSSLDILTSLTIDVLKLDKVFMKTEFSADDRIIIACIVDMAKKLGMTVLCEGVENEEQRQLLIDVCCDQMQGYYFSKPINIDAFNKLLEL